MKAVSDDDLLRRFSELLKQSRRCEADLITHIAEIDERKLYAREAASSMFVYCTEIFHLSEQEAYLRIAVARASREHPMLLDMLRDGRLHLSGIARLAPHLSCENRDTLLARAAHKSHRQIVELIAELAPRAGAPAMIRRLPRPRGRTTPASNPHVAWHSTAQPALASTPQSGEDRPESPAPESWKNGELCAHRVGGCEGEPRSNGVGVSSGHRSGGLTRTEAVAPVYPSGRRATIEPLAPARFRFRFDAGVELRDKIERLQALMRSSVPDGDLAKIIDAAVTEKLERLEAKRFGKTKTPRKRLGQTDTRAKSRPIPAAVRRFVEKRDGGRCTYRDTHGRRCTKRHDLEFHHLKPFGRGGEHSPENLRLMCRAHNGLLAEHDYGKEVMARFRRSGSLVSEPMAAYAIGSPPPTAELRGAAGRRTSAARVRAPAAAP